MWKNLDFYLFYEFRFMFKFNFFVIWKDSLSSLKPNGCNIYTGTGKAFPCLKRI